MQTGACSDPDTHELRLRGIPVAELLDNCREERAKPIQHCIAAELTYRAIKSPVNQLLAFAKVPSKQAYNA